MTNWDDVMVPNYGTPGLTLAKAQGIHVTDTDGRTYTDLLAGIAVNALGHAHPAIVEAVTRQVSTLGHTSNLYAHQPGLQLASRLRDLAGGQHKVLYTNSGTEANEAALKLVRKRAHASGRSDGVILAFNNSFHGRTSGALALTGQPKYQVGFQPLPDQIVHIPYNDAAALDQAFTDHDVVGVFAECVQGEGGVVPMQKTIAARLRKACTKADATLVVDEVQTGIGRTGRFFSYEHMDLRPDVITLSKALGGGMPLGAALVHDDLAPLLGPGSHGCTFGGHPVSCAAGLAMLDVMDQNDLIVGAASKGAAFLQAAGEAGLSARGLGLLLGIPVPEAGPAVKAMRNAGYLVGQAGPQVVRLAPPLIVEEAELLGAVPHLAQAVGLKPASTG